MTDVTALSLCSLCARTLLLSALMACGASAADDTAITGTASAPTMSASSTAGASAATTTPPSAASGSAAPQRAAAGTSAAPAAGIATAAGGAAAAVGGAGASAAVGGAGAAGSGTALGTASAAGASAGAAGAAGASSGAAGSAAGDLTAAAKGFAELFIDVPCDSATRAPLADQATCGHPPMTQHIEKPVTFGGESGKQYKVTLRIRGIWEPTYIMGGMRPIDKQPFTVGGMVMGGSGSSSDAINYQQYYIEVAEPKQTYWLNDYQYVAHDIHKQDYEAALTIAGGAAVKVVMNDGNDHEIANYPKEMFSDVPPYDKMPSLGQSLRLDVVKVEVAP